MGKITGFLDYERDDRDYEPVEQRVKHWREFVLPWIGRRLTGRSSGDGRAAKRPTLSPVEPT